MKIRKLHNCTVLEIETTNDAFTCGVIASKQEGVSLDMQDYGLKGIRIVDGVLLNALCGGGVYLAKGQVANAGGEGRGASPRTSPPLGSQEDRT